MSVDNPGVIDFVGIDKDGTAVLVMVEGRSHDGSVERLQQLEDKLNAYVNAVGGDLLNEHPNMAGRPVRIELRCFDTPDRRLGS